MDLTLYNTVWKSLAHLVWHKQILSEILSESALKIKKLEVSKYHEILGKIIN